LAERSHPRYAASAETGALLSNVRSAHSQGHSRPEQKPLANPAKSAIPLKAEVNSDR